MAYRRPNPAADKAAANQSVIKSLLKLPANKFCADCKRNKLPRWASWNLGIFICIRCSGIHRGMGTHISRVKSVDLDSWTDEQLASMVKWGNARANKYWEANLAPGHVPAEAKIENFIRTKYEAKRWVLSKEIPDPSTLGDEEDEDELPLKVVQQKLEQKPAPQQALKSPSRETSRSVPPPSDVDLIGGDPTPAKPAAPVERPSSAAPAPKVSASSELFGEFFGSPASNPTPTPTTATSSSRPDLNRSILSLYASVPKSPPQQQAPVQAQTSSGLGDLSDSFSGLSFGATNTSTGPSYSQPAAPAKPSPFANLTATAFSQARSNAPLAPQLSNTSSSSGFFSSNYGGKPPQAQHKPTASASISSDFDIFASSSTAPTQSIGASADILDLFDTPSAPSQPAVQTAAPTTASAFNLSTWSTPASKPPTNTASSIATTTKTVPLQIDDPWADLSSNTAAPSVTATSSAPKPIATVSGDDDWGNFSSSTGPTTSASIGGVTSGIGSTGGTKGMDDDLFGNVWG